MYASGSLIKNNGDLGTNQSTHAHMNPSIRGSTGNASNAGADGAISTGVGIGLIGTASTSKKNSNSTMRPITSTRTVRSSAPICNPAVRSKFTERKNSNSNALTNVQRSLNNSSNNMTTQQKTVSYTTTNINTEKKKSLQSTNLNSISKRIWNRNNNKETQKIVEQTAKICEKVDTSRFIEIGIQTNESEIVDYDLLIGDIKFMLPSKMLVTEIDRNREEVQKKLLLKTQRKYEEHSERQAEHLTDLKEFLEKAVITKKPRKPREILELDRKLINSMDALLNKEVPKTESITDIKSRIKQKEKELLTLFETVENIQIFSNKNS